MHEPVQEGREQREEINQTINHLTS